MKFRVYLLLIAAFCLVSCENKKVVETTVANDATIDIKETETTDGDKNQILESVNKMSQREFSFDPSIKFSYNGNEKYLKEITDDMVADIAKNYEGQGAVEIPTPYICKIDEKDKNDIKVYGDFWIYGYEMYGTIFNMKNGGSYPGCYHLKDDNGNISVTNKEFAEDGSNNWPSLVKICGGDEELAKSINAVRNDKDDSLRCEYAKMYARANNLKLSGIKDYGWPIILFEDISDATFLYNFYSSYFDEVKQEDYLNDMPERLNNLKKKYLTESLINDLDLKTIDMGADSIINAQDVTEQMLDTLQVDDYGNGNLVVSMNSGSEDLTKINVKIEKISGNRKITNISY